jgi:hypothetical protein
MKKHTGAGIRNLFRFLLILTGVAMIAGGAYLLHARKQYNRRIAEKQQEVCAALEEIIPGYTAAEDDGTEPSDEAAAGTTSGSAAGTGLESGTGNTAGTTAGTGGETATGDSGQSSASGFRFAAVSVGGVDCTGILEIPAMQLKVAVASADTAPVYMAYIAKADEKTGSFSIAGGSRDSLLGRLPEVNEGAKVVFTDVYGNRKTYSVNAVYTSDLLPEGEDHGQMLYLCCPQGSGWFIAECTER